MAFIHGRRCVAVHLVVYYCHQYTFGSPIGPNKCHTIFTLVSQVRPEIIFQSIVQEVPLRICVIIPPYYFPQGEIEG